MSSEVHNPHNPDPWEPGSFPSSMKQAAGTGSPLDVILDWLRALGLNPDELPVNPRASVTGGQLTLLRNVQGPNGGDVLTPDRTAIMTETITVPVTVPPPPIVEIWLAPKCPGCGR